MNKTITVYELLGMIKDGKAPKMIRYFDKIFTYNDLRADYLYIKDTDGVANREYLTDWIRLSKYGLNDAVEIIEDNDKLEKIEKLDLDYKSNIYSGEYTFKEEIMFYCDNLQSKINVLIDHINKIEERLDEK